MQEAYHVLLDTQCKLDRLNTNTVNKRLLIFGKRISKAIYVLVLTGSFLNYWHCAKTYTMTTLLAALLAVTQIDSSWTSFISCFSCRKEHLAIHCKRFGLLE